jgi:hypothetical protein
LAPRNPVKKLGILCDFFCVFDWFTVMIPDLLGQHTQLSVVASPPSYQLNSILITSLTLDYTLVPRSEYRLMPLMRELSRDISLSA